MEGTGHRRCQTTQAQGKSEDETGDAPRQDVEGLRQPLWYVMVSLFMFSLILTRLLVVVPDMKLSPNVGSDRSWVWNAAADVSEGEPEAQTLAIRFANSESMSCHITFRNVC